MGYDPHMTDDTLTGWRLALFYVWLVAGCVAFWWLAIRALANWIG